MLIQTLRHKWLIVAGLLLLFLAYIGISGAQKSEMRNLNLTTKVTANIIGIGKCDRYLARSSTRGNSSWVFIPSIEYEYRFAETKHISTQVYRSKDSGYYKENECWEFVRRLQGKSTVDVWIDPKQPTFSTIDSTKRSLFLELAIGFFGIFLLFVFSIINFNRRKKL